jgi:hypothetical protein
MRFKVLNGRHTHFGKTYIQGDIIDTCYGLNEAFPDRFELLDDNKIEENVGASEEEVPTASIDEDSDIEQESKEIEDSPNKQKFIEKDPIDVSKMFEIPEERDLAVYKVNDKYMLYDTFEDEYISDKKYTKKGMVQYLKTLE